MNRNIRYALMLALLVGSAPGFITRALAQDAGDNNATGRRIPDRVQEEKAMMEKLQAEKLRAEKNQREETPAERNEALEKRREFEKNAIVKTFYLSNATQPTEIQDIVNALRNTYESRYVFPINAMDAIVVRDVPDRLALEGQFIDELDKARKKFGGGYRLDFDINEVEGTKKLNTRSYSALLEPHESAKLRIGTRIPIQTNAVTASTREGASDQKDRKDSEYLDVGQNMDFQITSESEHAVELYVDVDFADLAVNQQQRDENAAKDGDHRPVLRQLRLTAKAKLELGKPTIISTLADPSSNHIFQIEATATRVKERE